MTYHETALPLLKYLDQRQSLAGVVLPKNRPKKTLKPVISYLEKKKIIYRITGNCNSDSILKFVKRAEPDIIISFNFPQIFGPELLSSVPRAVNLHAADLPDYRGPHPLNWAIINGEKKTALSAHFLAEKIDGGNLIAKIPVKIEDNDSIADLSKKVSLLAPRLMKLAIGKLQNPNFSGKKMDLSKGKYYPARRPEDGRIDWQMSSRTIINLIRAVSFPWPGAFSFYGGKKIIIDGARVVGIKLSPGEFLKKNNRLFVGTKDSAIEILKVR